MQQYLLPSLRLGSQAATPSHRMNSVYGTDLSAWSSLEVVTTLDTGAWMAQEWP